MRIRSSAIAGAPRKITMAIRIGNLAMAFKSSSAPAAR
jgi:hypothetical protein